MFEPVRLALDNLLDVIYGKDLQRQREVVRIQEELSHVLEFEDV